MALLRTSLPPRGLAGIYARIIRRELGFSPFGPQQASETGFFARSLAAALGQAFAAGQTVRAEFALALRDRLRTYQTREFRNDSSLVEAINHSVELAEIVAGIPARTLVRRIEISDKAVASATQSDLAALAPAGRGSRTLANRDLWNNEPTPKWWAEAAGSPDQWVASLSNLGEPLWEATRLSPENLTYLLNFGLDRIDSKPKLIEPWTQSVSTLVAAASTPRADVRRLVDCCRIDP